MRLIEVRKNITIAHTFAASSSFTASINTVNFTPDEVIVRSIIYDSAENENDVSGIYTNMVQDIIGSFIDGTSISPNITFTLQNRIEGQYTFQLLSPLGVLSNRTGDLYIHLEFIKYK